MSGESRVAQQVLAFHREFGVPVAASPTTDVGKPQHTLRAKLQVEETLELMRAVRHRQLVKIADALADIVYVAYGTALTYGIDLDEVLDEVHRSNMTKSPPEVPGGKAVKGPGYEPPQIAELLTRAQQDGGRHASPHDRDGEGRP